MVPARGARGTIAGRKPQEASPIVTVTVRVAPPRTTVSCSWSPVLLDCTALTRSSLVWMTRSPALVMTSPPARPAFSAGLPLATLLTVAPPLASAVVTFTPRYGWVTLVPLIRLCATALTRLPGIAKPTPMLPSLCPDVAIAVLMPITWALRSTSAPPELPGLIAASVWMAPAMSVVCGSAWLRWSPPSEMVRSSALTIPEVTEPSRPSGLPIASTVSPTRSAALSPNFAAVSPLIPLTLTTARSVRGSVPTIRAVAVFPSKKLTCTVPPRASATTWLLVTMLPSALKITPEPSPVAVRMATTLGLTAAAMSASEERSITFTEVGAVAVAAAGPATPPPPASSTASRPVAAIRPPVRCDPGGGWYPYPGAGGPDGGGAGGGTGPPDDGGPYQIGGAGGRCVAPARAAAGAPLGAHAGCRAVSSAGCDGPSVCGWLCTSFSLMDPQCLGRLIRYWTRPGS